MITNRITPKLPPCCELTGFLYESDNPAELSEDMLEVELPNGLLITAGWYPGTPKGQYWVSMFRGCDEVVPAVNSKKIEDAVIDVERFARQYYYRNIGSMCDSDSTISKMTC